eukprot:TRINITY_DN3067_c0_g1_i1.p3 TRINITY_DN3067_c0_g1~~TRINITY_DN3067_c0_g1_i1.p3  ORF type:complete len:155 (+),score=38.63 TRINITY_DN3067_c0_g1_i1:54-467(+)
MERAARAFGLDAVCNLTMQRDAELQHILLLIPRLVRLVKMESDGTTVDVICSSTTASAVPVFELRQPTSQEHTKPQEWLYEVGKISDAWAPHNTAMRLYLDGRDVDEAMAQAGSLEAGCRDCILRLGSRSGPLLVHL